MKGQNSAGDDRHETNSVSMNTQLWGVLYIPLPRQGRAHVLPHIPAKEDGGEGGRKRGNKAKSGSSHFPLSPSAQYIYVFAAHALAYHPLSDEGDDATLQMNPITHQGGRPPHSLIARASPSPSLSLPPCGGDFSSGLQWRIGSMDDGRTKGRTPFFAPLRHGPSNHQLHPSPFLVLSLESPPSRACYTLIARTL